MMIATIAPVDTATITFVAASSAVVSVAKMHLVPCMCSVLYGS